MEKELLIFMKVGTKAQSKLDLYRLLTVEGGMYLPPEKDANMDFISDIAFQNKKVSLFINLDL